MSSYFPFTCWSRITAFVYANPGSNGCVSGSVLFPPPLFFCIWGRREMLRSLCGSPTQRLRRLFGRLASSFMNIHPGIICLSGRRRRLLTSAGWCELPHNHDLTFSYGATVAVELTALLSRALRCPYTTTEGPGSTQQMRNLLRFSPFLFSGHFSSTPDAADCHEFMYGH